ncbi:MAG: tellurite methyltransferase [Polaribacter sp.]|jgi:tellurite methyltransferase
MSIEKLRKDIGGIDIYVLDQILKGRYAADAVILDAGCGTGRNLQWFYDNSFSLYGVDANAHSIEAAKEKYMNLSDNFSVQNLDVLSFENATFDHIICSAVLHFAQNKAHFLNMFSELVRVLKPGGSLFIRMASLESIEEFVKPISDGVYFLPDITNRFLLTDMLLKDITSRYNIILLEPKKYVNVNNERCMCTLVLSKN